MPTYYTNEAQFEIRPGWDDQSVIAFGSPGGPPKVGLVVTKQPLVEGQTAESAIERHLRATSQKLRRYELLENRRREVGGLPAWDVRFTFAHEGTLLYQRQIIVEYYEILWILTGSMVAARRAEADDAIAVVLDSVKFRRRVGA